MDRRENVIVAFAMRFLYMNLDHEVGEMLDEALSREGFDPYIDEDEIRKIADDFNTAFE